MTRGVVVRRLLSMVRPLAGLMMVSTGCRVVNQALGVVIPALAAATVLAVAGGAPAGRWLLLLVVLALVKGVFRYLEQYTGHAVAFRLLADLRVATYRHIEPLAPAALEADRTGDLVARAVGDVDRVEPFFAHTIAPLAGAVLVPVVVVVGLARFVDPVLAALLAPFPLTMALVVPWLAFRRVADLSGTRRHATGEVSARLTDAVQGSRDIAMLGAVDRIAAGIDDAAAETASARRGLARVATVRAVLLDALAGGAVVAVAVVGASRLAEGAIDLPGLGAALAVAWTITAPARVLEDVVPDVEQALAAAGRLFELADRPPAVPPPRAPLSRPADGSVVFSGVSVAIAGRPVLADLDVGILAGGLVAVVGPSGSGKSTLVELLLRFRDPDRGSVAIGGADLRHLPDPVLRSAVAFVPQRPQLFFGTIADNLRLADPLATDATLTAVLTRVGLAEWIGSLATGIDTPIGELGETMSGGQRQRVTLARALLREAPILVLDEATSELDLAAEEAVWQVLEQERGRRTVIVVAHRLPMAERADDIVVLDAGRLVGHGRHEQLVAAGGVYAALWQRDSDRIEG